jgi:hypothetical protein
MHSTPPADLNPPQPSDPPFLIAILIGAMKTGDRMMVALARQWLADIGIRITFAKDAPALRPAIRQAQGGCHRG